MLLLDVFETSKLFKRFLGWIEIVKTSNGILSLLYKIIYENFLKIILYCNFFFQISSSCTLFMCIFKYFYLIWILFQFYICFILYIQNIYLKWKNKYSIFKIIFLNFCIIFKYLSLLEEQTIQYYSIIFLFILFIFRLFRWYNILK